MIDCRNESTLLLLVKDYDNFIFVLFLSFLIVLYLRKSLTEAIFKSFVVLCVFLAIDMSCYHIGYIKGLFISLVVGTQLDNIYQSVSYFVVKWGHKKKKQIKKILGTEFDDGIKDKQDKTK